MQDGLKITERNLVFFIEDKLINDGFNINKIKKDKHTDIEAFKDGKYYIIELKGSEKPSGDFFKPEQENTHFAKCLFQLCCKFPIYGQDAVYIMVIPEFGKTLKFVKQLSEAIKKLGIEVWIVDKNRQIKVFN